MQEQRIGYGFGQIAPVNGHALWSARFRDLPNQQLGHETGRQGSDLSPCIMNPFPYLDSPFLLTLYTCSQGHGRTDMVVPLQHCLIKGPKTLTTLPLPCEIQSRLHDFIFRIERPPKDQGLWQ